MLRRVSSIVICLMLVFSFNACVNGDGNGNFTEPAGDAVTNNDNIQTTSYTNSQSASESAFVTSNTVMNEFVSITIQESTTGISASEATTAKTQPTTAKPQPTTSTAPSATQKITTTAVQVSPSVPSVSVTSAECLHKNTTIKNKLNATSENDGYTGDTYCDDCGVLINKGEAIEYVGNGGQAGMVQYPCPDGSTITVPVGTNVFDYTMNNAGKMASHEYHDIENEVFRLFNEERARLGIPAVSNNENAYYYVKTRAIEIQSVFSHTRPNGDIFSGVYEDEGIILCAMAENLVGHMTVQEGENVAQRIYNAIMSSPSHKATALDRKYNQMSVAVTYCDGQYYFCQHMYENVAH